MLIIMRSTRTVRVGGESANIPRFFVSPLEGEDAAATMNRALALSQRLNRASSIAYYMAVSYPEARRGPDHNQWMAAALECLQALDPDAPADAEYAVHEALAFTGPANSSLPMLGALMQMYATSGHPVSGPHEAIFRTMRDVGI